jgi:hypothetical protein
MTVLLSMIGMAGITGAAATIGMTGASSSLPRVHTAPSPSPSSLCAGSPDAGLRTGVGLGRADSAKGATGLPGTTSDQLPRTAMEVII